jgi:hypothetical protein
MTDPVRRDPTYFLRTLKRMAHNSSWQKSMIFAAKGRMIGYHLNLEHYNTVLFSQSLWGRALEITKCIRAMQEDQVQPNGVTYYYICNGLANADHGYANDFPANRHLPKLQHWRTAINALMACEANGFDASDTMYNSVIATCCIPGFNHWEQAVMLLHRLREQERKPHANMVKFLHDCLVRNRKPHEALRLLNYAADQMVVGYENAREVEVGAAASKSKTAKNFATQVVQTLDGRSLTISNNPSDPNYLYAHPELVVDLGEQPGYKKEMKAAEIPLQTGGVPQHAETVFRPRVYRYLWYKWHAIVNKYRPGEVLMKRQIAPKHSPSGIPGFWRL